MNVSGKITSAIGLVILIIFLLALTPTVVDQVQGILYKAASGTITGTTNQKWNFTGNAGAQTILGLLPFAWVAGVLLAGLAGVWVIATRGKD